MVELKKIVNPYQISMRRADDDGDIAAEVFVSKQPHSL
jgi:hypothetical protein